MTDSELRELYRRMHISQKSKSAERLRMVVAGMLLGLIALLALVANMKW